MRFRLAAWLSLALLGVGPAAAQDTGGSFGGGDWGGGGGDYGGGSDWGSSGSSDWGSSGSSDWSSSGSSDWSSSGAGGGDPVSAIVVAVLAMGLMLGLAVWAGEHAKRRGGGGAPRGWAVDVTALRLGLDWRARAFVQRRLDELARSGRTRDADGRTSLLRETIALLRRGRIAWLYAHVDNHHPMSPAQARGTFETIALDARARFREELVRERDGRREERAASARAPREHEGQGVVVVTVIVAARRELLDVRDPDDAGELERLLASIERAAGAELVALEVVWSPADERDRMSTAELEARYPELTRLDERTVGGRVFCGYCAGPYADELAKCPHCGAPHPRVERADLAAR